MELSSLKGKKQTILLDGREVKLTNLDKVFWPEEGYTKGDLISFYLNISSYLLPHLESRPLAQKRYPDGITGYHFFQKEAGIYKPDWVKTERIYAESKRQFINYVICNDLPTLAYLANLANISMNPWLSRVGMLDNPDFVTFDLDPSEGATFADIVEVALILKGLLDEIKLKGFVKTTGARGMHIYVPIKALYSFDEARDFAEAVAYLAWQRKPEVITLERMVAKREGKVYIDCLQNVKSKTLVSPYCLRARRQALVATPLDWHELTSTLNPKDYNIRSIFKRLSKVGDLWAEVFALKQELRYPKEIAA